MKRIQQWVNRISWVAPSIVVVSFIAVGYYLWSSISTHSLGFPLDDAWIHQTYARNLALRGEWAFFPGELSAGSTSPLWTSLLALGYSLSFPTLGYTYFLGYSALLGVIWLIGRKLQSAHNPRPLLLSGLLLIVLFEWHLVWAALSGMETLLLGLHILVVLLGLEKEWNPMILGGVSGIGIWIRPDALIALLPIAWVYGIQGSSMRKRINTGTRFFAGFALLFIPYLIMNYSLGGEWWPSTYYAKQIEYAVTRKVSLVTRLVRVGSAPLIGAGLLLLPGVIVHVIECVRSRRWPQLAGALWVLSFLSAYALRLPVSYQHGRYLIPTIPVLFLLGYEGYLSIFRQGDPSRIKRILSRSLSLSLALVSLLFWFRGAVAYGHDVAIIETEMVAAAKWIEKNTKPQDLIAAHDIGALGYFADRRILDLAGLVSPEVIAFIRDESALDEFLQREKANFLMTFPGWYPQLTQGRTVLYRTEGAFSPSMGGENMTIYRLP